MADIGTLIGEWAVADATARKAYARKKEIEFEIQSHMREKYPDEMRRLEQGKQTTFKAESVQLSTRREYDMDKLRAAYGETHPQAFKTVTTVKVDGNALRKLWADAAHAKVLADTLIPSPVTVKVVAE